MPKYIELEKALQKFEEIKKTRTLLNGRFYLDGVMAILETIPAADVAPVVHGRWTMPRAIIECSKCGFGMFPDGYFFEFGECVHANESQYRPNFCPNCGVKLDLEDD